MDSLIARLVERAQNASKAASLSAPIASFAEPGKENPFVVFETGSNSVSQQAELSNLFIDILSGQSAIPIRVKIILDKIIDVLDFGKMDLVYLKSQWSREDYSRGYKMEYDGIVSNTFSMVDEQEAVDRLSEFIMKSPSAQSFFTKGYAPPLCCMKKFPVTSIASEAKPIVTPVQFSQNCYMDITPNKDVVPDMQISPLLNVKREEDFEINGLDLLARLGMAPALVKSEPAEPGREVNGSAVADNLAYILKKNKRVSCVDCGKSFCDRGALKTHRSAVHLREMHTCAVPGCGKQFNSTRSRDRHSANPNPKLHIPDPVSFQESLRNPSQVIATRLVNDSEMPILSPLDVKIEPLVIPEDTKENIPLLKKRPAEVERYDEKRSVTSEMVSPANVPFVSPVMPQLGFNLQMLLLQQMGDYVPPFSPFS